MPKYLPLVASHWLGRDASSVVVLMLLAAVPLAVIPSAQAASLAQQQCAHATSVEAGVAACSSVINKETDRNKLVMAYFDRAGWYEKQNKIEQALLDLTKAAQLDPNFSAGFVKRGLLYEQRWGDTPDARSDYATALKLPEAANSLGKWAHEMAQKHLAALDARAADTSPATSTTTALSAEPPKESLTEALAQCNAPKESQPISLPGKKGDVQLNRCYRGRQHLSCVIAAMVAEANSIKHDYADIVAADYPDLKTLDSICRLSPDQLVAHANAIQTFKERWAVLRKEYSDRADCANNVEDSLRNLSLADMSYGADIVKSMVQSVRADVNKVSQAEKDVISLADKMDAAQKAIQDIVKIRTGSCQ